MRVDCADAGCLAGARAQCGAIQFTAVNGLRQRSVPRRSQHIRTTYDRLPRFSRQVVPGWYAVTATSDPNDPSPVTSRYMARGIMPAAPRYWEAGRPRVNVVPRSGRVYVDDRSSDCELPRSSVDHESRTGRRTFPPTIRFPSTIRGISHGASATSNQWSNHLPRCT